MKKYSDVFEFQRKIGFTWDEIEDGLVWIHSDDGPTKGTLTLENRSGSRSVIVSPWSTTLDGLDLDQLWARRQERYAQVNFLDLMWKRSNCSQFAGLGFEVKNVLEPQQVAAQ